jgi:hypothetical protein
MDEKVRQDIGTTGQAKTGHTEQLHAGRRCYLGIDIGSTSSDVVVLDEAGKVLFCDYRRTKGRPIEVVLPQLQQALKQLSPPKITLTAATGSAGRYSFCKRGASPGRSSLPSLPTTPAGNNNRNGRPGQQAHLLIQRARTGRR